ncbi:MAG: sulfotransferase, partial [Planctomycetes bacterium]|nr:sulfotransferase [Planctomycetota bacterium]
FLLTEKLVTRWLRILAPPRRPMDNMAAGFDRPQEDEFALCMMGQPSPYLTIAFPNHGPQYEEYLDLEGVPARARASWQRAFLRFLQQLTFKDPRRLVLKSPPHSARIKVLLELFPEARFIHIIRDPYVVFPSTVKLWKTLYRTHGLQKPNFVGLEEHVLKTFTRLYERLEEGKKLIDPARFYELRYEDLVRDPVGQMRRLYEHLALGGFDRYLPRLQRYLAAIANYETNKYQLTPEMRQLVSQRWGEVIRRYGYDPSTVPSS